MSAIVVGLLSHIPAVADTNRLLLQDVTMQNGGSAFLSFQLENEDPITGFQCDLYLPAGVTADSYMILLGRTYTERHDVTTRQMEDGAICIVCASATSAVFSGNSGEVLSIRVSNTLGSGQYEMSLRNVILTDPDATRYVSENVSGSITVMDSNRLELHDLTVEDVESIQTLPIYLKNNTQISGFQCDLYLPEGVEVLKNGEGDYQIDLKRTNANEHSVVARQMDDGALRIVCGSMSDAAFSGNDGEVLNVQIKCELEKGSYEVGLKNIILTNSDAARFTSSDVSSTINVTVRTYTITYILDGEVYAIETLEYGAEIVPPVIPGLEDYTIWEDVPETMPASDITIYGKAKEIIDGIISIDNGQLIIDNSASVYDLSGRKINFQLSTFNFQFKKKGLNIIRMSDGTVKKVLIK